MFNAATDDGKSASDARPTRSTTLRTHVRRGLIIFGVIAVAVFVWDEYLKYNVIAKNFGVVEDGAIYRSGKLTPRMLEQVAKEHGIRTIIDFGGYDAGSAEELAILAVDERLHLNRHSLPMIGDGTGDPNMMIEALHLMADESQHPILVHCAAGAQRTGVCILLYDVLVREIALEDAYGNAMEFGHDPGRNWHFPMFVGMSIEDIARAYHNGTDIDHPTWQHYMQSVKATPAATTPAVDTSPHDQ